MLLNVSQIAKAYGDDVILAGVTFRLDLKEKVALVGRNGAGKTTLLRILTQQIQADAGTVHLGKGAKVGYLRQEAPVTKGSTVLEEAQEALKSQLEMRARLSELEQKLAAGGAQSDDLDEYAMLHEHFVQAEGYSAEQNLRVVLQKMGFTEDEYGKSTDSLSGGEKTRLAIARLLLEEPDLLILDEPTNHLDLQATEWLENWLRGYHGAVLLVSHDRAFLENTADRVLEMRNGTVKAYPGPFAKYLKIKAEDEERQAEVAKRQEMEIAKLDEFVRRFMNSQRTAEARGRLKLMNRLIQNKVEAPTKDRGMKAGFGAASRSGELVAVADKLSIGFGGVPLLPPINWTARYGERWGVIGENGAGKSTLIKAIMGLLDPLSGTARLGAGVVAGYFSQDNADLDLEVSPLDMMVYELDLKPPEARNLLARFLITGDDVYRPIRTLSGGEKNKLSLARLTHLNPNLLVLDEPTNHLDMDSREALAGVIQEFKGTLVLISHDRWLLEQVTDHTLDVRKSGVKEYPGSYAEYRGRSVSGAPVAKKVVKTTPVVVEEKPQELTPRELSKEIQRLEKLVATVEDQIAQQEESLRSLEAQLADLPATADVFALTREHQQLQEALEGSMSAWEESSVRLESLRGKQG
jgi:ATP-binding cassette subfamily F protein 3